MASGQQSEGCVTSPLFPGSPSSEGLLFFIEFQRAGATAIIPVAQKALAASAGRAIPNANIRNQPNRRQLEHSSPHLPLALFKVHCGNNLPKIIIDGFVRLV